MNDRRVTSALLLACLGVMACAAALRAAPPVVEIGSPVRIEVIPVSIRLTEPGAQAQLVVTGHYAGGEVRDLTAASHYDSSRPEVAQVAVGVVRAQQNGSTTIAVRADQQQAEVTIEVTGQDSPAVVSFRHAVLPALAKQGCSSAACHGSPSGKAGFRLSLWGYDPDSDHQALVRDGLARRTNPLEPAASLLLLKPMMRVPHGGGLRIRADDAAFSILRQWIAQGGRDDGADSPACTRIEVYPPPGRVLAHPAQVQQLAVLAYFSDGSVRDVTPLAAYTSSDETLAAVSAGGLLEGRGRGELGVTVRYQAHTTTISFTLVRHVPGFVWNNPPAVNYVDELVHAKLKQLCYLPSEPARDDEFFRRVHLDVLGILPEVSQVREFLADKTPDKRARLIDRLLADPQHARYWALRWGDLLRLTIKQLGAQPAQDYYQWLQKALEENLPYDQFARQLLTAAGSTRDNPAANYFRAGEDSFDTMESTVQVFLGAQIQCAKCHNHPVEAWTQNDYYGLSAFFQRIETNSTKFAEEFMVTLAAPTPVTHPGTGRTVEPWLPTTGKIELPEDEDPREHLARWLTSKENPYFARVEVNRIWALVMGRGLVEPFDDFRDSNPPAHPALLEALAADFIEHGFDRRHILRTILNSRTYQASVRPNDFNGDDRRYFSHAHPRLLGAEQLLDAISHLTGVPETFSKTLGDVTMATQLPAPDMVQSDLLRALGQPQRSTTCQCERPGQVNLGQAMQLFNGNVVHGKLRNKSNRFYAALAEKKPVDEIVNELYLAAYCRFPQPAERNAALAYLSRQPDQGTALEDLCWALMNTNEFLYQH